MIASLWTLEKDVVTSGDIQYWRAREIQQSGELETTSFSEKQMVMSLFIICKFVYCISYKN